MTTTRRIMRLVCFLVLLLHWRIHSEQVLSAINPEPVQPSPGSQEAEQIWDELKAATDAEGFQNAASRLQNLADKGDRHGQLFFAVLVSTGLGRPRSTAKALVLYQFALLQVPT